MQGKSVNQIEKNARDWEVLLMKGLKDVIAGKIYGELTVNMAGVGM